MRRNLLQSIFETSMPLNIEDIYNGNKKAIARAISVVENESKDANSLLEELYSHTGGAYRLGITGPPGAGKSTLVDNLTRYTEKMAKV